MLTNEQKIKLVANWGKDKTESLDVHAEARIYDGHSAWQCFIFALDPYDMDTILCLVDGFNVELTTWTLSELSTLFNEMGDQPINDPNYVPRKVSVLLKTLQSSK